MEGELIELNNSKSILYGIYPRDITNSFGNAPLKLKQLYCYSNLIKYVYIRVYKNVIFKMQFFHDS